MQGESAVLNVLTIPPGASITSPRIVLDGVRGAVFVYGSGGPLGSLIGSWAGTGGTDPYGNVYPAGLNVNVGAITGVTIISTGTGLNFLAYNGAPAANNLVMSFTTTAQNDNKGNAVLAGFSVYFLGVSQWTAVSIQAVAGGCQVATYYTPGLTETGWILGAQWIAVGGVSSPTGAPMQYAANGQGLLLGTSTPELTSLNGWLQLANNAAPSAKSGFATLYTPSSATSMATVTQSGYTSNISNSQGADFTPFTVTAATAQQCTRAWSVPSGDAQVGTIYKLTFRGHGTQGTTAQSLVCQFSNGNAAAAIGSGFAAASSTFFWKAILEVTVFTATAANYFTWFTAGTGFAMGFSQAAAFSTPFTLEGAMHWGSVTGAPTVTCNDSYPERLGQ